MSFEDEFKKAEREYGVRIATPTEIDEELVSVAQHWQYYEDGVLDDLYDEIKKSDAPKNSSAEFTIFFGVPPGDLLDGDGDVERLRNALKEDTLKNLRDKKTLNKKKVLEDFAVKIFDNTAGKNLPAEKWIGAYVKCTPDVFLKYYRKQKKSRERRMLQQDYVAIKKIELNERIFSVLINDDILVSFRSKKIKRIDTGRRRIEELDDTQDMIDKERYDRETKMFKVFAALWDYRREIKNGKKIFTGNDAREVKARSSPMVLASIAQLAGCSEEGARQHIKRINEKFATENFKMQISSNGQSLYQLIIYYG